MYPTVQLYAWYRDRFPVILFSNLLCNSLRQSYKAKSMDHEIQVTDLHIFYKVDLWVTLIHYRKYNISPSKSLQDMTIKYRSLTYIYLIRSVYVTHWSIIPTMMFIYQIILKILSKITRPWNIGHEDLYLLWDQSLGHTVLLSENMTLSVWDIWQNHWSMKYRSHRSTFILRSNIGSYWPIIPKYDVHTSNRLQDVTQNHWTMKHRSQSPTFILRSNVWSYWFIIPNKDVHTSNNLQDIWPNHWTMKYRSQWPTFILRSNVGSYWFILPKYDVHT